MNKDVQQNNRISFVSLPYKSLAAAILLAIFFGPIGLLYASFFSGVIMTIIFLIVIVMPSFIIGKLLLFVAWLICPFLTTIIVMKYNNHLYKKYLDTSNLDN